MNWVCCVNTELGILVSVHWFAKWCSVYIKVGIQELVYLRIGELCRIRYPSLGTLVCRMGANAWVRRDRNLGFIGGLIETQPGWHPTDPLRVICRM